MASLRIDISDHARRLAEIQQRQLYAIEAYGKPAGNKMVRYAKANRPWTDRTRTARNNINSSCGWHGSRFRINLHSGIDYGVYLEFKRFAHKGRLSIWFPTVRAMGPEIKRAWADRMKGV